MEYGIKLKKRELLMGSSLFVVYVKKRHKSVKKFVNGRNNGIFMI